MSPPACDASGNNAEEHPPPPMGRGSCAFNFNLRLMYASSSKKSLICFANLKQTVFE